MKKIIFIAILLGLTSLSANAQTRSLRTEKDGFQWYDIFSSDRTYQGAESVDGKTLIPLSRQYTFICYISESGHKGYFNVKKEDKGGACDIYGREIIAPKYKFVFYTYDGFNYEDAQGNYIPFGITLDANGRASSYGHTGSTSSTTRSASSATSHQNSTQIDVLYSACYDENMKPLPKGKGDSPIEYIARFIFNADQIVIKVVKVERALNSKETIITETKFDPKKCNYKELGNGIEISDVLTDLTVNPSKDIIVLRNRYENVLLSGYAFGPLDDENLEFLIMLNEYTSAKELALEEQYNGNLSKKVKEVVSHLKKYSYKNR